ncbi:MAG TPA: peptide-methionine (S)-S-oxide reductase MsrA [Firmicutes bacterium]|nr:peptide-methionine (S)-S-oxide reductase MsrA [Bacillota bacterium]
MTSQIATLGGGCFWCLEAVFKDLRGVSKVTPGYSGGHTSNPTYEEVCTGDTGHAEVVRIEFDPKVISYEKLLEVFFTIHDPTTLNRQGGDIGTQYRSVIFYHDGEQKQAAEKMMEKMASLWEDPLVTEVSEAAEFFAAEEYHKDYFNLNPNQGYCRLVISPKVAKFRADFADLLRS